MCFHIFKKTYWCGENSEDAEEAEDVEMAINESELFEAEPDSGPKAGIMVSNLRKVFPHLTKADVVAVNSVSFKVTAGCSDTLGKEYESLK